MNRPNAAHPLSLTLALVALCCNALIGQQATSPAYAPAVTNGTRWFEGIGGLRIKMLVEASNLGGAEVELGEITFPAGSGATGRGHTHTAVEVFYILSGELHHVVNDTTYVLQPGMVGIVRPGDRVIHRVPSDTPVRALVIWAPGGEAERLASFFTVRPIEQH